MAHHGPQWLDREDVGDLTVVRFVLPRLWEEGTNRAIFGMLAGLVDAGRHRLLLNLGKVEYITSDVISGLVLLNRKLGAVDGRLALCELTEPVKAILQGMRLLDGEIFEVYATEADGIASLRPLGEA
jgi:anti-sigma B factor antagonist